MKLVKCTKFHVNRMSCVEKRRGGGPIDLPPSRLRVTIFFFDASRIKCEELINSAMMQTYESLIRECRLEIGSVYGITLQSVHVKVSRLCMRVRGA